MQNLHSSARTAAKTMFKRWALLRQAKIATILMLAAVASNLKARWTAKKFDIWKECQDDNRKSDSWLSGDWISSDGKLYYGNPFFIFFESAQNDWWLQRNSS